MTQSPPGKSPLKEAIQDTNLKTSRLELAALVTRHTPDDGTFPTAVPRLHLIRASQPGKPLQVLHEPALCLVVQGRKRVLLGEQTFTYDPAQSLCVSVALPLTGEILEASAQRPYLCLRLDLAPAVLRSFLLYLPELASPQDTRANGLSLKPVTQAQLGAATRLVALLDTPEDIPVLAPLLERELLYRALKADQWLLLRQLMSEGSPVHQVSRALTWLKEHFTEPFSMDVLAAEAHLSPSALYEHFRAVTSLSPLQYQKQLRLQEARRLLLSQQLGAAQAGHAVGYESPSQFSREYRRQFGITPARDAAEQRKV